MKLDPLPRIPPDGQPLNRRLAELFADLCQTVNALSEGRISARYQARDTMPTTGTYAKGDYVHNSNPVKLGVAASRYVNHGWIRLVSGDAHVLFTDWCEDRRFSGD